MSEPLKSYLVQFSYIAEFVPSNSLSLNFIRDQFEMLACGDTEKVIELAIDALKKNPKYRNFQYCAIDKIWEMKKIAEYIKFQTKEENTLIEERLERLEKAVRMHLEIAHSVKIG